ncbi:MAG: peptidoglycan -binding protein [Azospirillum sp.]|nr:peptidoglycan -binding protein [Azospirillum sp.]
MSALRKQVETGEADRGRLAEQFRMSEEQRREMLAQISSLRASLETSQGKEAALGEELRLTAEQRKLLLDQLAGLRDRSQQLEAQLASEAERTMLRQKEIDKRDIRIKELLEIVEQTRGQLVGEQDLTARERSQVSLLGEQIAALKEQLARLATALESSERKSVEQKIQIDDLGKRLNVALATKVEELAKYRSEFFGRLRETLGSRQDIRIVGDRFVFQSEVLFGTASATLEEAGKATLARTARTLIDLAAKMPSGVNWILRVDGHTDRRGIANYQFPSNWELSTARAISVVKFLIEQGIPAERLAATGFGEFQPLDAGTSEEALARNRRIELKFDQR